MIPSKLKHFQKYGFSAEDYVNFWFNQLIPIFYREGKISSIDQIEKEYIPFITSFKLDADIKNLSYEKYQKWLTQNMPSVSFEELIDGNIVAPVANGNYLQRLSSLSGYVRDRHIVKIIFEAANKYEKILVVYGQSHFLTQKMCLKTASVNIKLWI